MNLLKKLSQAGFCGECFDFIQDIIFFKKYILVRFTLQKPNQTIIVEKNVYHQVLNLKPGLKIAFDTMPICK